MAVLARTSWEPPCRVLVSPARAQPSFPTRPHCLQPDRDRPTARARRRLHLHHHAPCLYDFTLLAHPAAPTPTLVQSAACTRNPILASRGEKRGRAGIPGRSEKPARAAFQPPARGHR
ncbi:hypothetical protein PSPO01_01033 [Paraphaeosphaeria sporulosa]